MNASSQQLGLRERNKQKRRAAIVSAALELFAERGYAATTIIDIAEAAEVAPRTISLYFPTKLDIALVRPREWSEELISAIRLRSGMSTLDALATWMRGMAASVDPKEIVLLRRVFAANPELRGLNVARMRDAAQEIVEEIVAEQGVAADQTRARIAAVAMLAVTESIWFAAPGSDVNETIDLAVDFLKYGLSGAPRSE